MNKRTKKYLEEENEWLWYYHTDIQDDTEYLEIKQYDKKGELIAMTSGVLSSKKHRPKHPSESFKELDVSNEVATKLADTKAKRMKELKWRLKNINLATNF